MTNGVERQPARSSWTELKELTKHVFVGVGVFILLAIPALALDFFNQAIELIQIQGSTANAQPAAPPSPRGSATTTRADESSGKPSSSIRVSRPVRLVLVAIEYVILGVDVVFVVGYLANGMWTFLRAFKWK